MFCCIFGVFSIILLAIKYLWKFIFPEDDKDNDGYEEKWYGKEPRDKSNEDTSIRPFKIDVPNEILEDLNLRLERARFEDPVEDSKFQYGFNSHYLKEVTKYWKTQYNWREEEKILNKYPHFKTTIEGIDVHFMHVKPYLPEGSQIKIIPIVLIHGWPGCFAEFIKAVSYLTTPRQGCSFVFEVICPSIPGYGFSESPHQQGFNAREAARLFTTLMERIGHPKYYVQGGDWGSFVASLMARYYPNRVLGLHVNMFSIFPQGWRTIKVFLPYIFPFLINKTEYYTLFPLKEKLLLYLQETGYFHMQATKPDSLGCGMCDSPVGMAAYILEKFSTGTNTENVKLSDGGLTKKFSMDELLTNIMIYWVNNNFTSAARFYKENIRGSTLFKHEKVPVTVPSGVAVFPNEPLMMPRMLFEDRLKNIVSFSSMPRGGHFAAMEEPELFSDDVWKFVGIAENKN